MESVVEVTVSLLVRHSEPLTQENEEHLHRRVIGALDGTYVNCHRDDAGILWAGTAYTSTARPNGRKGA